MLRKTLTILASAVALLAPVSGVAQSIGDVVNARFLPGWRQADGSHVAGLLIELEPGWKTYWRSPGDAGIPPRFDWTGSRNIASLQPHWPTPRLLDQNGLTSIGYAHDVVVPLVIQPTAPGRDISLQGRLELGICREICVPAALRFGGELTATAQPAGQRDSRIVASLANQPLSAAEASAGKVTCRITPADGALRLRAEMRLPSAGGQEFVVIEAADPSIWVAEAVVKRNGPDLIAETEMRHVDGAAFALNRSGVRFTVLGRDHAVDLQGCGAG